MGKKLREDFTAAEYAALLKSGKKFLNVKNKTDQKPVCFIQDTEADFVTGGEYRSFSFTECEYDSKTHVLRVGAAIVLEKNADLSVRAKVVDMITGKQFAALAYEEISDTNTLNYKKEAVLLEGAPSVKTELAVVVTANWQFASEDPGKAAIAETLQTLDVTYHHQYPKKEEGGYVEFINNSSAAASEQLHFPEHMEIGKRGEADTLNIALFRKPDDTDDLDYLCNFGKDVYGRPHFTIPAAGELLIKDTNLVIESASVNCWIREKDSGTGYFLAASGNSGLQQKISVSIDKTRRKASYSYIEPWDNAFIYGGGWQKFIFEYLLQIILEVKSTAQTPEPWETTEMFYIRAGNTTSQDLYSIDPYISIMWGCLAGDTKVRMADGGEKNIRTIAAGDKVKLLDGAAVVKTKWSGPSEECVIVEAAGRTLIMTNDHPVRTAQGWKRAIELRLSDELMSGLETYSKVEKIKRSKQQTETYNLEYEKIEGSLIEKQEYLLAEGFVVGNLRTQNDRSI